MKTRRRRRGIPDIGVPFSEKRAKRGEGNSNESRCVSVCEEEGRKERNCRFWCQQMNWPFFIADGLFFQMVLSSHSHRHKQRESPAILSLLSSPDAVNTHSIPPSLSPDQSFGH